MGKKIHKLSDINAEERTGTCAHCGPVTLKWTSKKWWRCNEAVKSEKRRHPSKGGRAIRDKYRDHKGDTCESCGFIPAHTCQLDVDHIDGNHSNNDPSNLQTLCANCHRLKTHMDRVSKL